MNREIYQYELPWNALQLNSEDIYLSIGVGYVPDEEMLKQLDLFEKRDCCSVPSTLPLCFF